jgi:hypothetical protein
MGYFSIWGYHHGVLQYLGVAAGVTPLQAGPPASVPLYWLCLSDMRLGVAGCLQGSLLLYPGRSCVGLTGTHHPMAPDIDDGSGHPRLRRALVSLDVRRYVRQNMVPVWLIENSRNGNVS